MEFLGQMKSLLYLTVFVFCIGTCVSFGSERLGVQKLSTKQRDLILNAKKKQDLNSEGFVLTCYLENIGDEDINLFFLPYMHIEIFIKSDAKEETLKPSRLYRYLISKKVVHILGSRKKHTFDLEITTKDYVWPKPGIYEARVSYENMLKEVDGIKVWIGRVESNTFQVEFR